MKKSQRDMETNGAKERASNSIGNSILLLGKVKTKTNRYRRRHSAALLQRESSSSLCRCERKRKLSFVSGFGFTFGLNIVAVWRQFHANAGARYVRPIMRRADNYATSKSQFGSRPAIK